MKKKQYIIPLVENITFENPVMRAFEPSAPDGLDPGSAPGRRRTPVF